MKWILIGFFSAALMVSVMLSAGIDFIGVERLPSTADAVPLASR